MNPHALQMMMPRGAAQGAMGQQMYYAGQQPGPGVGGIAAAKPADCLAYIDDQSVLLFWKSAGQQKPNVIPVDVVECNTGPGGTMCHIMATPSTNAPDGIDRWVPRCEGRDVGTKPADCLAYIDETSVMLFWKSSTQQKPDVIPVTVVECTAGPGSTMCHVTAGPSANAPDGIDRWLPRCEGYDVRTGRAAAFPSRGGSPRRR